MEAGGIVGLDHGLPPGGIVEVNSVKARFLLRVTHVLLLADEDIRVAGNALVAPLEALVRDDDFTAAVLVAQLDLQKQRTGKAKLAALAGDADAAGVPAVGQLHAAGVAPLGEQRGDVVGLVADVLAIGGELRGQEALVGALPVEAQLIDAVGRGVGSGLFETGLDLKLFPKQGHGHETFVRGLLRLDVEDLARDHGDLLFGFYAAVGRFDPLGGELRGGGLKMAALAGLVAMVIPDGDRESILRAILGDKAGDAVFDGLLCLDLAGLGHDRSVLADRKTICSLDSVVLVGLELPGKDRAAADAGGGDFVIDPQVGDVQHCCDLLTPPWRPDPG